MAHDFWFSLLRSRNDALCCTTIRYGQVWLTLVLATLLLLIVQIWSSLQSIPKTNRRHHSSRDVDQQNGGCVPESVRPNARTQMGYFDGQLC